MRTHRHGFSVFLAIAALAVANCVGPQMALAAHHPAANKVAKTVVQSSHDHATPHENADGRDHDAADGAGLGTAQTDGDDAAGGLAKVCCSTMTCMASAVMVAASAVPVSPIAASVTAAPLDDMLRAFNAAAIDPPPRNV